MEATAKAGLARALDRATTVVAVLMSIYHLVACNINLFQAGPAHQPAYFVRTCYRVFTGH